MYDFEITEGLLNTPLKVVVYGVHGIGKTTLFMQFPDPLFIDTEGSTKTYNVRRLPVPTSWQMLLDMIRGEIIKKRCKTLIIDTADWAETLCINHVCAVNNKPGIESFGYGNGYTFVKEEWARFLNLLTEVTEAGMNIVLGCHSIVRKFESPDEMGAYDRYELKLGTKTTGQTAPITKEWCDMLLFLNFETFAIQADDKGKKFKAQGGKRVIHTTYHPCWDAKNRHGLPDKLPLEKPPHGFDPLRHIFENLDYAKKDGALVEPVKTMQPNQSNPQPVAQNQGNVIPQNDKVEELSPIMEAAADNAPLPYNKPWPKALDDLMNAHLVSEDEIRKAVAFRGYFPFETPISNYPQDFINGVLIGAWPQVFEIIESLR